MFSMLPIPPRLHHCEVGHRSLQQCLPVIEERRLKKRMYPLNPRSGTRTLADNLKPIQSQSVSDLPPWIHDLVPDS